MRTHLHLLAFLICLGAAGATAAPWQPTLLAEDGPEVIGKSAPEPKAPAWFNHIGQTPSLASLRGKVWVVEMWATW